MWKSLEQGQRESGDLRAKLNPPYLHLREVRATRVNHFKKFSAVNFAVVSVHLPSTEGFLNNVFPNYRT
ncbi:MAG: hypothetical protein QW187_03300, partial [Candidatus Korarchaeum sp.]